MELSLDLNKRYMICDLTKLDERGCCGALDMIVEILSFSTARYDLLDKYDLYEASGVKEYWVVHPMDKAINVYILQENGKYNAGTNYEWDVKIPIHVFGDYLINLQDLFEMKPIPFRLKLPVVG